MPPVSGGPPRSAREPGPARPVRVVLAICVVGLVLTGVATWAVARVDTNTEERLLDVQTRQAAAVLSTAILGIQQPMTAALDVQEVAGKASGGEAFTRLFSRNVGADQMFLSASLWHTDEAGTATRVTAVGAPPGLDPRSQEMRDLLDHALSSSTWVVDQVRVGDQLRIAYAAGDPATGYVVYAERAIPADRRAPVDRNSAFADLDYAIYLGPGTDTADMTTTSVDPASLPLDGLTSRASVPFGDTVLTLVTSPRTHLGSPLSQRLPLALLVTGLLLTLIAALVARQLVRSRQRAENDTETITTLYQRVDSLYGEQREHFVGLQRALLPQVNPHIPGIEIASQYVAASKGIDIGGDWYSLITIGDQHFAFVVGDVSGHGIDAVAEMARARFTLRAYLVDGAGPEVALEKCSRQFDVSSDGHIVTALVGVGNWRTGEMTLANAGHPPPLLASASGADFVPIEAGPPLGAGAASYRPATFTLDTGDTLISFTDGLVERRTEDIDSGLQRLAATVRPVGAHPLGAVIVEVLDSMRNDDTADDVAILALRRTPA
jgi:serine phosphatase RsbU (regulator of sigma subunit)/type II secretory pathway pseudopilin PulG